jgi:hypothetical protein
LKRWVSIWAKQQVEEREVVTVLRVAAHSPFPAERCCAVLRAFPRFPLSDRMMSLELTTVNSTISPEDYHWAYWNLRFDEHNLWIRAATGGNTRLMETLLEGNKLEDRYRKLAAAFRYNLHAAIQVLKKTPFPLFNIEGDGTSFSLVFHSSRNKRTFFRQMNKFGFEKEVGCFRHTVQS